MASLLLSFAGQALGGALGPAGAIAGRALGALAGGAVDRALFGDNARRAVEGPRLNDLAVMGSTEGAPIPRLYGRARLSGQVIWATKLEEVVSTRTESASGGKGSGPRTTVWKTFASLASISSVVASTTARCAAARRSPCTPMRAPSTSIPRAIF
jgi:hypothetical protein